MASLNEEAILFDPDKSRFFVLNHTGSFLWAQLSEPNTAEHLAREICKSFDGIELADALPDVQNALRQLLSLEIIVAEEKL
jgi:Coenzyme PQQ synthesis protein D (PqqD)